MAAYYVDKKKCIIVANPIMNLSRRQKGTIKQSSFKLRQFFFYIVIINDFGLLYCLFFFKFCLAHSFHHFPFIPPYIVYLNLCN